MPKVSKKCPSAFLSFEGSIMDLPSVPGGIRTHNLLIRSQMLYPVELQTQKLKSQVPGSKSQSPKSVIGVWDLDFWDLRQKGGRRDSNPQQPEPQSGALPLSYDHRRDSDSSFLDS